MSWLSGYGFNFRNALAFVTDGADEAFFRSPGSVADGIYPLDRPPGVTAGWVAGATSGSVSDLDAGLDRRLAGACIVSNSVGPAFFRVDLPSAGSYEIGLAFSSNSSITRLQVFDDASLLFGLSPAVTTSRAADANGVVHEVADWPANQTLRQITMVSTTLLVRVGSDEAGVFNSTRLHHLFVRQLSASQPEANAIVFATQPASSNVGSTMSPIIVHAVDTTEGSAIDTTYAANVTLTPDGGSYLGTLTKAAVAGVATFDDLVPQTIGTGFTFDASSGVFPPVTSNAFDIIVPSGGGSPVPLENEPMSSPILRNAADGDKRRIYFLIFNDNGSPFTGSVGGIKAQLNGTPSTNDIVRVSEALHYIELTQPESTTLANVITAVVAASAPRRAAYGVGLMTNADWTDAGLNDSGVRSALGLASANLDTQLAGIADRTVRVVAAVVESADGTQVTIPFEGGTEVWTRTPSSITSRTRQLTPP